VEGVEARGGGDAADDTEDAVDFARVARSYGLRAAVARDPDQMRILAALDPAAQLDLAARLRGEALALRKRGCASGIRKRTTTRPGVGFVRGRSMAAPGWIEEFVRYRENAGVRYMVTGSVASMIYGEPRLTLVVHLVVELAFEGAETLLEALRPTRRQPLSRDETR